MIKKWIVVLGFAKLPIAKKIALIRAIKAAMTGNSNFGTPRVSMADMDSQATRLETKESEAAGGDHSKISEMHEEEFKSEIMMNKQIAYVEEVANDNFENGKSIIEGGGMKAKKVSVHTAKEFNVENTKTPGEVKARTKFINRAAFMWWKNETPADESGWKLQAVTNKASVTISGLPSISKVAFRVAVVVNNVQGPFSNVITLTIL